MRQWSSSRPATGVHVHAVKKVESTVGGGISVDPRKGERGWNTGEVGERDRVVVVSDKCCKG